MNCKECKEVRNKRYNSEIENAYLWKANKLLVFLLTLCLLIIAGMFAYDKWEDSQYEDVVITQEVEQDAENGENHFVGGDMYGETTNQNNN